MLDIIFKKLFGDKAQKDLQELFPIVDLVNIEHAKVVSISDDELRAKTIDFKSRITNFNSEVASSINSLKEKTQLEDTPIHEKDAIFKEIDTLEKQEDERRSIMEQTERSDRTEKSED